MSKIQRYDYWGFQNDSDGEYVKFKDHEADKKAAVKEAVEAALKEARNKRPVAVTLEETPLPLFRIEASPGGLGYLLGYDCSSSSIYLSGNIQTAQKVADWINEQLGHEPMLDPSEFA